MCYASGRRWYRTRGIVYTFCTTPKSWSHCISVVGINRTVFKLWLLAIQFYRILGIGKFAKSYDLTSHIFMFLKFWSSLIASLHYVLHPLYCVRGNNVTQKLYLFRKTLPPRSLKNDVTQCYCYVPVTQVSKDSHYLLRDIIYEVKLLENYLCLFNLVTLKSHNFTAKIVYERPVQWIEKGRLECLYERNSYPFQKHYMQMTIRLSNR